jgi:hypothetical protein
LNCKTYWKSDKHLFNINSAEMLFLFLGNLVAIWERKKVSLDHSHVQKTSVILVYVKNGEIPRPRAFMRNLHGVFSLWPVLQ